MITMSKAKTASGAKNYFAKEYEHARGSYYAEEERLVGVWNGALAEEFGLSNGVTEEQFTHLANGRDPRTGAQLIRQVKAHEREGTDGKMRKTLGHRAGVDITLSAPKSVTLACVVGGDERIREVHRAANLAAMREVECHVQARLGGNKESETTGKAVIATFEHDVARPDKKNHYAAPDLHSHNFVFNITKTGKGKPKSIDMAELYHCQKLGTAVYRVKLAEGLQRIGYEIRLDECTGAPEIKSISREYIEASSPRQAEIKETAERMRAEGKQMGMVRADGSTSTRAAATVKRRSKVFDRDEMKLRHQELEVRYEGQARTAVDAARTRAQVLNTELLHDPQESRASAKNAVTYAVAKISEREAVNRTDALLREALERGLGAATLEDVRAEIKERYERGELTGITDEDAARRRVMTEKTLATERANIEIMRTGQNTQPPISQSLPKQVVAPQGVALNENQRAVVEQIVASRDRVQGVQGGAGTGKTTLLAAVKVEAERTGYRVEGCAPTTRAAQLLSESGIESKTLQKFIREWRDPDAKKRLLILDESSLASTKQLNAFLSKANPQDRIVLVGDVRQHEAVEAGSPFAQLQTHGMKTARLEKIVRQKEEPLRRVVEKLAVGAVKSAVDDLNEQGRITEIADGQKRLHTIARDYTAQPDGTLVISPRNNEREELNRLIHDERRRSEQLNQKEHTMRILRNRNELTGAERTFAGAYRYEDVIRFNTNSKIFDVKAGEYARVDAVNRKANLITVEFTSEEDGKSGRRMTYDPKRLQGVSVYEEAEIKISEGERIQFRAPAQKQRISNGELGTLEKIEKNKLTVKLDSGRRVSFPASENPHLDYGYAVTSHSSQGQTVDRVLVNMDTHEPDVLLNQRMAYVAASRTRTDVKIYTDSASRLGEALARQVNKSTALEALPQFPQHIQSHKEVRHGQQRSTESPAREDEAREGTIIARPDRLSTAFDRSRISRIGDAGAGAGNRRENDRAVDAENNRRISSDHGRAGNANQSITRQPSRIYARAARDLETPARAYQTTALKRLREGYDSDGREIEKHSSMDRRESGAATPNAARSPQRTTEIDGGNDATREEYYAEGAYDRRQIEEEAVGREGTARANRRGSQREDKSGARKSEEPRDLGSTGATPARDRATPAGDQATDERERGTQCILEADHGIRSSSLPNDRLLPNLEHRANDHSHLASDGGGDHGEPREPRSVSQTYRGIRATENGLVVSIEQTRPLSPISERGGTRRYNVDSVLLPNGGGLDDSQPSSPAIRPKSDTMAGQNGNSINRDAVDLVDVLQQQRRVVAEPTRSVFLEGELKRRFAISNDAILEYVQQQQQELARTIESSGRTIEAQAHETPHFDAANPQQQGWRRQGEFLLQTVEFRTLNGQEHDYLQRREAYDAMRQQAVLSSNTYEAMYGAAPGVLLTPDEHRHLLVHENLLDVNQRQQLSNATVISVDSFHASHDLTIPSDVDAEEQSISNYLSL